jgi:hypothetical protein
MRFIPTKTHAVMDYVMGILLIAVPLFWLDSAGVPQAAIWTPVVIGALMLLQSLITDYELSLANIIPMSGHLTMDAIAGIVLAASPWLFGFAETIWWPHLLLGLGEIGAAMTTHTHRAEPARASTTTRAHT